MRSNEVNVLVTIIGEQRYILLYDDRNKANAQRKCYEWGKNPYLPLNMWDAVGMAMRISGA